MIELIIFHLHIVAALYAFTKFWQKKGVTDGLLAVGVVALVFVIGWSIAGTIANLIYPDAYNSMYFSQDTLGLIILAIPESIFFYHFFVRDNNETEDKKNDTTEILNKKNQ
jgi:hypothetical protein